MLVRGVEKAYFCGVSRYVLHLEPEPASERGEGAQAKRRCDPGVRVSDPAGCDCQQDSPDDKPDFHFTDGVRI